MVELNDRYQALKTRPGLIDRSDRARIEVGGADRAKFLHNLTTNDVKRLAVGAGQEGFVTSPQGKTLGFLTLLALDDRILLRTDPGGTELILPHLRKYGVFDDVTIDEVSDQTFELHLIGRGVDELLRLAGGEAPPASELRHGTTEVDGVTVRVIRESPTGRPGLTLIGAKGDESKLVARLRAEGASLGLVEVDPALFETLRIEAGTPVFGRDVTHENLPQELGRDPRAISFVKGCYLGQETVARIDALGHVNKLLKGLKFLTTGDATNMANAALTLDGKGVGRLTSVADSPGWGVPIALGYVRSAQAVAGTELLCQCEEDDGEPRKVVVCDLPMLPPDDAHALTS